jgi:hypothetical protein
VAVLFTTLIVPARISGNPGQFCRFGEYLGAGWQLEQGRRPADCRQLLSGQGVQRRVERQQRLREFVLPACPSIGDFCSHRRVVGGPLQLAQFAADPGRRAALGEHFGKQDVVDPQPLVLLETEHAVVPPRKALRGLLEKAEAVFQAESQQALESCTLWRRTQDLSCPGERVVDVPILWCDVEIAGQDHPRIDRACIRDPPGESIQPFELVSILVAADRLPVGDVRADDADAADCGGKEALLLVRVQRVAVDDIGWAFLRQQGNAVVGLLSGKTT